MNAFANPEEASPYELPEFPKPEEQVSEYAHIEGVTSYQLKDFVSAEPFSQDSQSAPIVQPAVLQDFREMMAQVQS